NRENSNASIRQFTPLRHEKDTSSASLATEAKLFQVPELVPDEILVESGAKAVRAAFAHVPIVTLNDLVEAGALIFRRPTRFGNMCAQMRNFLDQSGGLWARVQ